MNLVDEEELPILHLGFALSTPREYAILCKATQRAIFRKNGRLWRRLYEPLGPHLVGRSG